nr:hypothetical protein [Chloroflexota bacterium]
MNVLTLEGSVENGQIKLTGDVHLPEKTRVLIVVPDMRVLKEAHLYSPRLVHPLQAADFKLEVIEPEGDNADVQS